MRSNRYGKKYWGETKLFDVGKYTLPDYTAITTFPKCAFCWTFEAFALGVAYDFVANIKLDVFFLNSLIL